MPSCKSFENSSKSSSRRRCHMRGNKSYDNLGNSPEAKSFGSRSTGQQGSFIIEFRRWLMDFWHSVINHLKGVFSKSRNLQSSRIIITRIKNFDSDSENAFWREGRPYYIPQNKYPKINIKTSDTNYGRQNRNSQSRSRENVASINPIGYKNNQWQNARRKSSREIKNFTENETTDEEYFALYKKSSHDKQTDKSREKYCCKSSGDCFVEPIEIILSRYNRTKSSSSATELRSEISMEPSDVSDEKKKCESKSKHFLRTNNSGNYSFESTEDGRWIDKKYFASVWQSKSELDITPETKSSARSKNRSTKIPRLRRTSQRRSEAGSYFKKSDDTRSSICQ